MRLINTTTLTLEWFFDQDIPPYAILSHTWGAEEVSFQEIQYPTELLKTKAGYTKIKRCCEVAKDDGFQYAWVDTCCIDKSSSSELSEAISSMYRWYLASAVCYVYLSDFKYPHDTLRFGGESIRKSRWFTRGWTLQELIAPSSLLFYGSDWGFIGTKSSLREFIVAATRIPENILSGDSIEEASVAQRMSWASGRKTTRPEDMAYCLMGLFGVHMPMIYGEGGEHAFLRLQEEILKITDDQSIFAWTSDDCFGLLAISPTAFQGSGKVVAGIKRPGVKSFRFSDMGINIELPIKPGPTGEINEYCAVLDCFESADRSAKVGIILSTTNDGVVFHRTFPWSVLPVQNSEVATLHKRKVYVWQSRSTMQTQHCTRYLVKLSPNPWGNDCKLIGGVYRSEGPTLGGLSRGAYKHFMNSLFLRHLEEREMNDRCDGILFSTIDVEHTTQIMKNRIFGALLLEMGSGRRFVLLLKLENASLSIEATTLLEDETLEDVALSYDSNISERRGVEDQKRSWRNDSDHLDYETISVRTRKQMILNKSTTVITVATLLTTIGDRNVQKTYR